MAEWRKINMNKKMGIVVVMFAMLLAVIVPVSTVNAAKKESYMLYLTPGDQKGLKKDQTMGGVVNKVTFSGNKITIKGSGMRKFKSGKASGKKLKKLTATFSSKCIYEITGKSKFEGTEPKETTYENFKKQIKAEKGTKVNGVKKKNGKNLPDVFLYVIVEKGKVVEIASSSNIGA